jgi:hypothetical protein
MSSQKGKAPHVAGHGGCTCTGCGRNLDARNPPLRNRDALGLSAAEITCLDVLRRFCIAATSHNSAEIDLSFKEAAVLFGEVHAAKLIRCVSAFALALGRARSDEFLIMRAATRLVTPDELAFLGALRAGKFGSSPVLEARLRELAGGKESAEVLDATLALSRFVSALQGCACSESDGPEAAFEIGASNGNTSRTARKPAPRTLH